GRRSLFRYSAESRPSCTVWRAGTGNRDMPGVIVVGGGLAGLATAAALGGAGFDVELYEARGFLGGRATSFPLSPSEEGSEVIDNCQHVLLKCCVNLLDFYNRLGVRDRVQFSSEFNF